MVAGDGPGNRGAGKTVALKMIAENKRSQGFASSSCSQKNIPTSFFFKPYAEGQGVVGSTKRLWAHGNT